MGAVAIPDRRTDGRIYLGHRLTLISNTLTHWDTFSGW